VQHPQQVGGNQEQRVRRQRRLTDGSAQQRRHSHRQRCCDVSGRAILGQHGKTQPHPAANVRAAATGSQVSSRANAARMPARVSLSPANLSQSRATIPS
jgi:hypothetical protein